MEHDIFFSISQTPDHEGHIPSEQTMFKNYFQQLTLADELGFGVGWIAQSHLSTGTKNPVYTARRRYSASGGNGFRIAPLWAPSDHHHRRSTPTPFSHCTSWVQPWETGGPIALF